MKAKIQSLLQQLNQGLVEREHVLKLAMLTTLAGENLVLVGPPGTGKSLVARRIAQSLSHEGEDGAGYFEYLLTKFSTPEELFGPLSIAALKTDRFHRNTAGYLPTVRMAFLDEIFKASSSILNALLTVLNERVYHNGTEVQKVPLQALIAASNELPTDQEELAALYDRFLVRVFVDYVGANNLSRLFETTTEPTLRTQDMLSAADLARVRQAADQVVFEPALIQAVQDIWAAHKEAFNEDRRESLSDRRLKKVIHLMRVSAATNGREAVDLSDVMLLKDCLWSHADNVKKVQEVVLKTLQRHSRQVPATALLLSGKSQAPAYELGSDGRTLVPARTSSALAVKATVSGGATGRMNAVVKGYAGSGTEEDPLLIQTVDDLVDLARPEVGQKGYHFRQTADISIKDISTWPEINFAGHYQGHGYTISDGVKNRWLFQYTEASHISDLQMSRCRLAKSANRSKLVACKTSDALVSIADECRILSCEAGGFLVSHKASGSKITSCIAIESIAISIDNSEIASCKTYSQLIRDAVKDSTISNCLAVVSKKSKDDEARGMITTNLISSKVEKCFVTGRYEALKEFSGIAHTSDDSTIIHNALGKFETLEIGLFGEAITTKEINKSVINDNITIDGNNFIKEINLPKNIPANKLPIAFFMSTSVSMSTENYIVAKDSKFAQKIAATRFKQRYFEHTMGWDFETIWIWDDQNDRPALRQVGIDATPTPTGTAASAKAAPTVDLLTQQVRANIWL
jgi:MoxR-like ATPase